MIRITKDDITLECETQADLQLALGVLGGVDMPPLPVPDVSRLPERDCAIGLGELGEYIENPDDDPTPRALAVVPVTRAEIAADVPEFYQQVINGNVINGNVDSIAPQMVPVTRANLTALEAVLCFPQGITAQGVSQLIGVKPSAVGHRLGRLRNEGLVERVEHSWRWRATQLARRAKLVAS